MLKITIYARLDEPRDFFLDWHDYKNVLQDDRFEIIVDKRKDDKPASMKIKSNDKIIANVAIMR